MYTTAPELHFADAALEWGWQDDGFVEHMHTVDAAAIRAQVSAVVEGMLGAAVAPNQPLMEAGLDSLGAVELRTSLCASFTVDLPATVVFDYPTVSSLSSFIAEQVDVHPAYSGSFTGCAAPLCLRTTFFSPLTYVPTITESWLWGQHCKLEMAVFLLEAAYGVRAGLVREIT